MLFPLCFFVVAALHFGILSYINMSVSAVSKSMARKIELQIHRPSCLLPISTRMLWWLEARNLGTILFDPLLHPIYQEVLTVLLLKYSLCSETSADVQKQHLSVWHRPLSSVLKWHLHEFSSLSSWPPPSLNHLPRSTENRHKSRLLKNIQWFLSSLEIWIHKMWLHVTFLILFWCCYHYVILLCWLLLSAYDY